MSLIIFAQTLIEQRVLLRFVCFVAFLISIARACFHGYLLFCNGNSYLTIIVK